MKGKPCCCLVQWTELDKDDATPLVIPPKSSALQKRRPFKALRDRLVTLQQGVVAKEKLAAEQLSKDSKPELTQMKPRMKALAERIRSLQTAAAADDSNKAKAGASGWLPRTCACMTAGWC